MTVPGSSRTLSSLLGGNKDVSLLEAFAFHEDEPLSASDAVELSGMAWATVHRRIATWVEMGLLREAGKEGKAPLYRLNTASPAVYAVVRGLKLVVGELLASDLVSEKVREPELLQMVLYRFEGNDAEIEFDSNSVARLDSPGQEATI